MPKGWFDADRDWGLIFGQNGGYFGEMKVLQDNLILLILWRGIGEMQMLPNYLILLILWRGRQSRITKLLSGFKLVPNILLTTLEMALIPLRNMILRKIKQSKENEASRKQFVG